MSVCRYLFPGNITAAPVEECTARTALITRCHCPQVQRCVCVCVCVCESTCNQQHTHTHTQPVRVCDKCETDLIAAQNH